MKLNLFKIISGAILSATILAATVVAQPQVRVSKGTATNIKLCESVVPASIEGQVDVAALIKEVKCKGTGGMLAEYTFVMTASKAEKNKKGQVKDETTTYEVFIPTLRDGTRSKGVLVATHRNGVPVTTEELEKERLRAGERLEKEEEKNARQPTAPAETNSGNTTRMIPVGIYPQMRAGGNALNLQDIFDLCELKLMGREQIKERDTLVFSFVPHPGAQFKDEQKYVGLLRGTVWIDAKDRIAVKLTGWPLIINDAKSVGDTPTTGENPPALYVEMTHLPEGVWMPRVMRLNGADYPKVFDINYDATYTFSEYKRFIIEVRETQVDPPKIPR
jgi:hypothetical protein